LWAFGSYAAARRAYPTINGSVTVYEEVVDKVAQLVTTSFGLVAALAWNAAIQGWFEGQKELQAGGPWIYALLVTVIAVLATVWIGRLAARAKSVEEGDGEAA
jgi:hypothetical protein